MTTPFEYQLMADDHYRQKAEEYASILAWAKKDIAFTPGDGILHAMEESGDSEMYGVSTVHFTYDGKDTGLDTCVHVEKALYDLCDSTHKDDPNFWIMYGHAGCKHVYSHDADNETEEEDNG